MKESRFSCGGRVRSFSLFSSGTTSLVVCLRWLWIFGPLDPTDDSGKDSGSGSWPGFSGEVACRGTLSFLIIAKSRGRGARCGKVRVDRVYGGWSFLSRMHAVVDVLEPRLLSISS